MKSKIISGIIALTYLIGAYLGDGGGTALKVGMFLILPLTCIWFSEEMGNYGTGWPGMRSASSPSPALWCRSTVTSYENRIVSPVSMW